MWREAQDTDEEGKKGVKGEEGEGVGRGESSGDGGGEMMMEMESIEGVQSAGEGESPDKVTVDTGNYVQCTYVQSQ